MSEHNTREAAQNRIVIEDFDFKTIEELLRYIYSERVENLKATALNLLQAADKVRFFLLSLISIYQLFSVSVRFFETQTNVCTITWRGFDRYKCHRNFENCWSAQMFEIEVKMYRLSWSVHFEHQNWRLGQICGGESRTCEWDPLGMD